MGRNIIAIIGVVVALTLASPAMADSVVTIDKDHGLTDSSKISKYQESGVASTTISVPELTITVSESGEGVGQDVLPGQDIANAYVQFEYYEDIPRTIRVYIPKGYFYPVTKEGLESVDGEHTADFRPTESEQYTAITVRFTGKSTAVFKVSKQASVTFGYLNSTKAKADRLFGIKVPDFLGGKQWKYITKDQFTNGTDTYAIEKPPNKDMSIQYDADYSVGVENWHPVKDCSDTKSDPVCSYEKIDDQSKTYILMKTNRPPAVRYKAGGSFFSGWGAGINELGSVPTRFFKDVFGAFG